MKADQLQAAVREPLGIARLLTAIFPDYSLRDIFLAMGLDLCPWENLGSVCRKPNINPDYYPYCAHPHQRANKNLQLVVALICHDCGIRFYRARRTHLRSIKLGQKHPFCGRICFGRWAGNNHGFGAHPENAGQGLGGPVQSHCHKGHPFSPENTYYYGSRRQCKTCNRERRNRHALTKRKSKLTKHMQEHW